LLSEQEPQQKIKTFSSGQVSSLAIVSSMLFAIAPALILSQTANQTGERLMLGACFAFAQKISELDRRHLAARRGVGLVQNKGTVVFVTAQKPTVTIFAVINLSLVFRHLEASKTTIDRDPNSFRFIPSACRFRERNRR
jgi:flagellar biogenesis protein FliO